MEGLVISKLESDVFLAEGLVIDGDGIETGESSFFNLATFGLVISYVDSDAFLAEGLVISKLESDIFLSGGFDISVLGTENFLSGAVFLSVFVCLLLKKSWAKFFILSLT